MIPVIGTIALSIVGMSLNAVSLGATAGTTYAVGRKTGRIVCEKMDEFESKAIGFLTTNLQK